MPFPFPTLAGVLELAGEAREPKFSTNGEAEVGDEERTASHSVLVLALEAEGRFGFVTGVEAISLAERAEATMLHIGHPALLLNSEFEEAIMRASESPSL